MLDGVSLDQLRAFIAAVDEGSFSAGARWLHRAQSAVSELVSNLEAQLRGSFRSLRALSKTDRRRRSVVADARERGGQRRSAQGARARGISAGLESELSAVVDVLFPIEAIAESAKEFRDRFPRTLLRCASRDSAALANPCSTVVAAWESSPPTDRTGLDDHRTIDWRRHDHGCCLRASARDIQRRHSKNRTRQTRQLVLTDRTDLTADASFGDVAAHVAAGVIYFQSTAFLSSKDWVRRYAGPRGEGGSTRRPTHQTVD